MSDDGDEPLYCVCKKPYDEAVFMIECNVCLDWFHGDCVSIEEHQAIDIEIYHCPACQRTHGPLKLKKRRSRKRLAKYSDDLDDLHDVKCGTVNFLKALKQRQFPNNDRILKKMKGHMVDKDYIEQNGFSSPILVKDPAGLDLKVPNFDFTVSDVEVAVGSMRELDVIDVAKQSDMKMLMREFVEYYNNPKRDRILNVISLEFSKTKLSEMVTPPRIITELSWVSNYWPESTGDVRTFLKPEVQKYCLMSVKDSYTDFHIDFGGTSVWYHVIKGSKIFYLIEPTDTNLALYETWTSSSEQNAIFFGDQVKACYRTLVKPGQTLFIPTGWIHSVFTPEDSLVFGGNFVHSYGIKMQLDVYEMERRLATPDKFSFPNMETLYWYAAKNLTDTLQEALDGGKEPCKFVLDGCIALKQRLNNWMKENDHKSVTRGVTMVKRHRDYIPEGISPMKLVKEFAQLISEITSKLSPTKATKRVSLLRSPSRFTKLKKKAPLKVKAKKRHSKSSLDTSVQVKKEEETEVCASPKQAELRDEGEIKSESSITANGTRNGDSGGTEEADISVSCDRATLLGLKFKLNRTQGSIKLEPKPSQVSILSEDSDSSADESLVVDDPPSQPTVKCKTYRFSLGGRNISELTSSTSDDVQSSDNNRSPQRPVALSKGMENLIKATSTQINHSEREMKVPASSSWTPMGSFVAQRKERLGTKLTRPIATAFIPAPSRVERESSESDRKSTAPTAESTPGNDDESDSMEKRLKSCYTDDTYVYPALEDSDYDDEEVSRTVKKRKRPVVDQAWVPKSRSKMAQPIRDKRPSREHAVKASVKAELDMAREYLNDRPVSTQKTKKNHTKKSAPNQPVHDESKTDDHLYSGSLTMNLPSTSMDHGYHLPPRSPVDTGKSKMRKSGGSTTKQRLGKLLKIHKMF